MEEKELSLAQEQEIKKEVEKLKVEKGVKKITPIIVFGRPEEGEKDTYVAYFTEPSFPAFSKFMSASKKDEINAMRTLAKDCFIAGDKELVDNDSLFLFGTMQNLPEITTARKSVLVNLSSAGK